MTWKPSSVGKHRRDARNLTKKRNNIRGSSLTISVRSNRRIPFRKSNIKSEWRICEKNHQTNHHWFHPIIIGFHKHYRFWQTWLLMDFFFQFFALTASYNLVSSVQNFPWSASFSCAASKICDNRPASKTGLPSSPRVLLLPLFVGMLPLSCSTLDLLTRVRLFVRGTAGGGIFSLSDGCFLFVDIYVMTTKQLVTIQETTLFAYEQNFGQN